MVVAMAVKLHSMVAQFISENNTAISYKQLVSTTITME